MPFTDKVIKAANMPVLCKILNHMELKFTYFITSFLFTFLNPFFEILNSFLIIMLLNAPFSGNKYFFSGYKLYQTVIVIFTIYVFINSIYSLLKYRYTLFLESRRNDFESKIMSVAFAFLLNLGKLSKYKVRVGLAEQLLSTVKEASKIPELLFRIFLFAFSIFIVTGVLFLINSRLFLTSLCILFVFLFIGYLVSKVKKKTVKILSEINLLLRNHVHDTIGKIELLKISRQEKKEIRRFKNIIQKESRFKWYNLIVDSAIAPFEHSLQFIAFSLLCFYFLSERKNALVYVFSETILVIFIMGLLTSYIINFRNSINYFRHIFNYKLDFFRDLFCENSEIMRCGKIKDVKFIHDIRFKDVSFEYKSNTPIFRGVSFAFKKGTSTAIIGESGSGKTTLVDLLVKMLRLNVGKIYLDGVDIDEYDLNSYRSLFFVVFQKASLFPDTILNNLLSACGWDCSQDKILKVLNDVFLTERISELPDQLYTRVGDGGLKLSGGEQQKIHLARAILSDAEIVILDEATNALDLVTENMVMKNFFKYRQTKTNIIISHRPSMLEMVDVVYAIYNGNIFEIDPQKNDFCIRQDDEISTFLSNRFLLC